MSKSNNKQDISRLEAKVAEYEEINASLKQRLEKLEEVCTVSDNGDIKTIVNGVDFVWHPHEGTVDVAGGKSLIIWIESSLAAMMHAFQTMVGSQRFSLAMQGLARDGVDGDFALISQSPDFVTGFAVLSAVAASSGWGKWELLSLDETKKESRFRVKDNWEALYQKALGVSWGSGMLAGKFAGISEKLFGVSCWAEQVSSIAAGDEYDEFFVYPSERSIEQEMDELLLTDEATKADMAVAIEKLRLEVKERKKAQSEQARLQKEVIDAQSRALAQLSTPIIPIMDRIIVVPLVGTIDSARAKDLMRELLAGISSHRAQIVILDITGVPFVDTGVVSHLDKTIQAARLKGAKTIVTGISDIVAETIVDLGIDWSNTQTLRDLQTGLLVAFKQIGLSIQK